METKIKITRTGLLILVLVVVTGVTILYFTNEGVKTAMNEQVLNRLVGVSNYVTSSEQWQYWIAPHIAAFGLGLGGGGVVSYGVYRFRERIITAGAKIRQMQTKELLGGLGTGSGIPNEQLLKTGGETTEKKEE